MEDADGSSIMDSWTGAQSLTGKIFLVMVVAWRSPTASGCYIEGKVGGGASERWIDQQRCSESKSGAF